MKFMTFAASAALIVACAACSPNARPLPGTPGPNAPISSSAPGASSQMPQSANSLPAGDRVNAPIQSPVGNVGTTTVGRRY